MMETNSSNEEETEKLAINILKSTRREAIKSTFA